MNTSSRKSKNRKPLKWWLKVIRDTLILATKIITVLVLVLSLFLYGRIHTSQNYKLIREIITETNDYYVSELVVMDNLRRMPKHHLQQIKDAGYRIHIDKEFLERRAEINGYLAKGVVHHKQKLIFIYPDIDNAGTSVLHECGHALNRISGNKSNTEEFQRIFMKESEGIGPYRQPRPSEYFADVYMLQFNDLRFTYKAEDFPMATEYLKSQDWW